MLNTGPLKQEKPLVKPDNTPEDILSRHLTFIEHGTIAKHLQTYRGSKCNWDEYARNIDQDLRDKMTVAFKECRQNGFFYPHARWEPGGLRIHFDQIIQYRKERDMLTACDLCEEKSCQYMNPHTKRTTVTVANCWKERGKT